jgi:hypothetical protein
MGVHGRLVEKLAQTRRDHPNENTDDTQQNHQLDQGRPLRMTRAAKPEANMQSIHEYPLPRPPTPFKMSLISGLVSTCNWSGA